MWCVWVGGPEGGTLVRRGPGTLVHLRYQYPDECSPTWCVYLVGRQRSKTRVRSPRRERGVPPLVDPIEISLLVKRKITRL